MAHTPALSALFGGPIYLALINKSKTFGPILVLALMMSTFFFFSGHFVWTFLPNLICALLAEIIAKSKQYEDKWRNLISYAIFSLGNLAPIVTMWLVPKAYVAQLIAEGKEQAYVDLVMIPATGYEFLAHIFGILVCSLLSGYAYLYLKKDK